MTGSTRWAAVAATLAVLGIVGVLWYAARPRALPPAPPTPGPSPVAVLPVPAPSPPVQPPLPAVSVEEGRIAGTDPEGRLQWELRAARLVVDSDRQEVHLEEVSGQFYDEGAPALTFTAARAVYLIDRGDVALEGGVRARTPAGRLLEADRVRWDAGGALLTAVGRVRLAQERLVIRADRLEGDVALRRTRLEGNVTVTVRE